MAIAACLIVGCVFSFRPMTADVAAKVTSETSQRAELQAAVDVKLVSKNIEDLQLGQRVVGRNPLRHETQSPSEIDPATWRAVRLHMIQSGVEYDLAFLRPLSWLESTGAVVGGSIQMELHEMGLNGPARVVGIDPCPFIEPDDGTGRNVVTGTMAHPGANIVYLDITGLDEPLGVTDTHPIWSQTRQNFVVAGQLKVGEQFRTVTGQSATLTRIHPHRGPPEMVFNLEVDGQHVYHVASSGLLVHNDCSFIDGTHYPEKVLEQISHGPGELHS
ncbi:MAG: polymorphic toxin-type HINT domain-containing protein, partial [Phycisphaerae bacterium]